MKKAYTYIFYLALLSCLYIGCKKDIDAKSDDRLNSNTYCNMPEAINYNIGFPGTPDNTKCIFPTQVFKGNYRIIDSILDADFKLKKLDTLDISLSAVNNVALTLQGFCNGTITMTANRYYKSVVDSLPLENGGITNKLNGQYLCGNKTDTISGWMLKSQTDSTKISINFTVATDSGIIYHQGTGTRK